MDNSFHPQRSEARRLGMFFNVVQMIFGRALPWLVGVFQLTKEEQREAGIYLDRPYEE